MSDLIYREDAKDFVRYALAKGLDAIEYLDEVTEADCPTAAVPVVRCKDCQLLEYDQRSDGDWHPWCLHFGGDVDENDYCSYGERKDGRR